MVPLMISHTRYSPDTSISRSTGRFMFQVLHFLSVRVVDRGRLVANTRVTHVVRNLRASVLTLANRSVKDTDVQRRNQYVLEFEYF